MGLAGRLQAIQNQGVTPAIPLHAPAASAQPATSPAAAPTSTAPSPYQTLAAALPHAAPSPAPGGWPAPAPAPSAVYGAPPAAGYGPPPPQLASALGTPWGQAKAPGAGATGPVGPADAVTVDNLERYLSDVVRQQGWHNNFWPPQKLRAHCEQLVQKDFVSALDMQESCPAQPLGLFCASLFDLMVLGDDSRSMRGDCATGRRNTNERWQELLRRFETISSIGSIFDTNGIDVYFLNASELFRSVGSGSESLFELRDWMQRHECRGTTPIGPALAQRVLPDVRAAINGGYLSKPIMVYVITDGVPDDRSAVGAAIASFSDACADRGLPKNTVLYSFSQVGDDRDARAYLASLDDDRRIGAFVDATSSFPLEAEEWRRNGRTMGEDDYLMKTIIGAADPNFDRQDDQVRGGGRLRRLFR